jgi:hypothetical protein
MSHAALESGLRSVATATNATSAVATITGVAGKKIFIAAVSGTSDKASAKLLVKDGTTVIWQDRVSNTCGNFYDFDGYLVGSVGANVSVTVDGTAECDANIVAFIL